MVGPGTLVVALKDGGHDAMGLPIARPIAGHVYVVGETYEMPYGLGCTLVGMDAAPYRGLHSPPPKQEEPRRNVVLPGG